jgi:hypothetical protein
MYNEYMSMLLFAKKIKERLIMAKGFGNITVRGSTFGYKPEHFYQHKDVLEYLHIALERVMHELRLLPVGSTIKKTVDLHRVIGQSHCVELNGDEEIFYAQRKGRRTLSKFVKGKEPIDSSSITFVLAKSTTQRYKILTAYIGYNSEREPDDPSISNEEEFNQCKQFWNNHALVEGSQQIFANSITTECPWDTYQNRKALRSGRPNIQTRLFGKQLKTNDLINQ